MLSLFTQTLTSHRNLASVCLLLVFLLVACGGGSDGGTDGVASWVGTKQLGAASADTSGYSIATDANGNVYVAGYTTGDLDGNMQTGIRDFFVTKYNKAGVRQYTRQLGVMAAYTSGNSVATDIFGNVYVVGYTTGDLDSNTRVGTNDFFITKYDSNGIKQYTHQLGVAAVETNGSSVATDTDGNVYVAGVTAGDLDGNTLTGTWDFFVTKYDSIGVKQFTRQLGVVAADTYGTSVATDANGNVYVAGWTYGGLDGNTLTGIEDFFFTKYDSTGVKQYTRQLGVAGAHTQGNSVTTDANGNVYVVGFTRGDLDGNTLTGTRDFFVTKYDSAGVKQYTLQLGVAGELAGAASVATDTSGNVYVSGSTTGNLDGNTLTGAYDFFVTKYDDTGVKQYTRQLGATGAGVRTNGNSVATDADGNVYVTGDTTGNLDDNTLTGIRDFFITKYDSNGVRQ